MTSPIYLTAGRSSGVARALLRAEPRDTATQLAAARRLRLGGTAGKVPPHYFADPAADLPDRGERGQRPTQPATRSSLR